MRVVQVMAGARHGGAEAFFMRLVPALTRAGLEQRAVIRTNAERVAQLRERGVAATELPFRGALDLETRWRLRRELARERPDVVMTWMNRATAACPRGRFVHVARLGGYYDPKYYRRCDHLVANTRDIAGHLERCGFPAARVHVLPNFVNGAPAAPVPRRALETPAEAPLVLALGRLHRNKAFDTLIEALARLPGVFLWLAGEGPERAALERQAAALGVAARIRFLGWREDVASLLAAADVLVCPSRHEPLGNVVLEAWAQSRPVVAAASAGPRALIEDGRSGVLVAVDAPDALAGALASLLGDPARAAVLAEAGHRRYAEAFTEAAVVAQYLAFFRRVAAERG